MGDSRSESSRKTPTPISPPYTQGSNIAKLKSKADMRKEKDEVILPKFKSLPAGRPTPTPQKAQEASIKEAQAQDDLLRSEKLARREAQEAAIKEGHIKKKRDRDFRKKEKKESEEKLSPNRASSLQESQENIL